MATGRDIIITGVVLFAFALLIFVVKFAADTSIDALLGVAQVNESSETVTALQAGKAATNRYDQIFFGLFIALILGVMIVSWYVETSPLFMGIYIIVGILGVIFGTIFASTWQTVTQASVFTGFVSNFPITNHILNYLPLYLAAISFIGMIVMFGKPYFGGGE